MHENADFHDRRIELFLTNVHSIATGTFMQNQDAISEPRNRNPIESQKSKRVLFFTSLLKHVKHHAHAPSRTFTLLSSTNRQTRPPVPITTITPVPTRLSLGLGSCYEPPLLLCVLEGAGVLASVVEEG